MFFLQQGKKIHKEPFCLILAFAKSLQSGKPLLKQRGIAHHGFCDCVFASNAQGAADVLRKPRGVKIGHVVAAGLPLQWVAAVGQAGGDKGHVTLEGLVWLPHQGKARAALQNKAK